MCVRYRKHQTRYESFGFLIHLYWPSICEHSYHSNPIVSFHGSHCHGGLCREEFEFVPEQGEVVHDDNVVVEEYAGVHVRNQVLEKEASCSTKLEPVNHFFKTVRVIHLH